jgi:hypothetical protein
MATTTNYGWTTPDDTALVKDGASAIRTLGSSVDTTTKALNPSTTLGDIEYRSSSANTNTRLGIGTTGQVLTVSGGVPAWATASAGGITLITETVASANTSIVFSSISQNYKQLLLVWSGIYHTTTDSDFVLRFNNASTSSYGEGYITGIATVTSGQGTGTSVGAAASWPTFGSVTSSANLNGGSKGFLLIDNYTSTTKLKPYEFAGSYRESAVGRNYAYQGSGTFDSTSAITSLDIVRTVGTGAMTNVTNTTIRLYGLS